MEVLEESAVRMVLRTRSYPGWYLMRGYVLGAMAAAVLCVAALAYALHVGSPWALRVGWTAVLAVLLAVDVCAPEYVTLTADRAEGVVRVDERATVELLAVLTGDPRRVTVKYTRALAEFERFTVRLAQPGRETPAYWIDAFGKEGRDKLVCGIYRGSKGADVDAAIARFNAFVAG